MAQRRRDFHYCENPAALPPALRGAVVAIGNFDGFHRGHQHVMRRLLDIATRQGRPAFVLSFEPHPRDFFARGEALFRLTDRNSKRILARAIGLDGLVILDFDRELSEIEPEDFIRRILVRDLSCSTVVVGENFRFGRRRRGDIALLQHMGDSHGYSVESVALARDGQDVVSSTRIRAALARGDVHSANDMLGFNWFVDATPIEIDGGQHILECEKLEKMPEGQYLIRGAAGPWPVEGIVQIGRRLPGSIDAILPDAPTYKALRFSILHRVDAAAQSLPATGERLVITDLDRVLGLV